MNESSLILKAHSGADVYTHQQEERKLKHQSTTSDQHSVRVPQSPMLERVWGTDPPCCRQRLPLITSKTTVQVI